MTIGDVHYPSTEEHQTESRYALSFLAPIRRMMQPTLLDLSRYLPDRIIWKQALIEQYTVGAAELEELAKKGWEPIDYIKQASLLFTLTGQLSLVLALTKQGGGNEALPELWARTSDIHHALRYSVVLVHESLTGDASSGGSSPIVVGTHAITFEQGGKKGLSRYELAQLGEGGQRYWQQIVAGVHPEPYTPKNSLVENMRYYTTLFHHAQDAALALSELYWHLHEQHVVAPIYVPMTVTDLPSIFNQVPLQKKGHLIPATDGLEAALYAISDAHDGGQGWEQRNHLPVYTHQRETSVTAVTIRHLNQDDETTVDVARQLWKHITSYSDTDGDVLLAMLAQVVALGPDEQKSVWITSSAILDYRGIRPKRHETSEPGEYRDAGHRPEDMKGVADAIARLHEMHVSVRSWSEARKPGGRRRKVTQESYLLLISDFLVQTVEGQQNPDEERLQIAWRYRPGEALGFPMTRNTKVAWLLQQTLHYDPYHEKWEKRLARYFMFQLRINSAFGGTTIKRSIGDILQEAGLSSELDTVHPDRNRVRFEEVMRHLKERGHISEWGETAYFVAKAQLPVRHWLDHWLSYRLEISAAPLVEELTEHMLDQYHVTTIEQPSQHLLVPKRRHKKKEKL